MSHLLRWATFVSLAGAVCLLTATPALAKTIHVHPGQSIQAAINAAKPGDTIVVDAGVYHENLVITKDRLQLEGAGPGATVLVTPATPNPVPPQCGSSTVFHGICVAGAFDAAGNPGDPVKGVQIEGFSVLGFPGFGILDLNAKDSTVENVEAAGNASYGISGALLNGISYFGNVSHDNGEPGVYVGDSPRAHAVVVGNTSYHNGVGGPEGFGFLFRDSSHGIVRDNVAHDNCAGFVFADTGQNPVPAEHWHAGHNVSTHNNGSCTGEAGGPPPTSGIGFLFIGTHDSKLSDSTATGNVPTGPSIASGGIILWSSAAVGGSVPIKNTIEGNSAHANAPFDILWDGTGSRNKFKHNDCDTSSPSWICSS